MIDINDGTLTKLTEGYSCDFTLILKLGDIFKTKVRQSAGEKYRIKGTFPWVSVDSQPDV